MGPAENMLEVNFLELWRILFKPNLGTVDSRMIKTSQVTGTSRGQSPRASVHLNNFVHVLLDLLFMTFLFIYFVIYNFPFLKCYRPYILESRL